MISQSGYRDPKFTAAEKAQIAVLIARMAGRHAKNNQASQRDLQRKMDRIIAQARKREEG